MTDAITSSARDVAIADALLRAAKPARDPATEAALVDRIVAAAERTPRLALSESAQAERAMIVPPATVLIRATGPASGLPESLTGERPAAASGIFISRRSVSIAVPSRWRTNSGAAGLMAASLLVGFLLGQTPSGGDAMRGFEAATGLSVAAVTLDSVAAEISEE